MDNSRGNVIAPLFVLLVLLGWLALVRPAEAAVCRTLSERSICILSIQRSAKNYWEYRAVVSVDGVERPLEVYNCRDRVRIRQNGMVVPFTAKGPGSLICRFFKP